MLFRSGTRDRRKRHARPAETTFDSMHPVIDRRASGEPPGAAAIPGMAFPRGAILAHRTGGVRSRWCGWDSCGGPGRRRVRICCKGAPSRDRPRTKARNINDSLSALRRDRGLCNRFGQRSPSGRSRRRPRAASQVGSVTPGACETADTRKTGRSAWSAPPARRKRWLPRTFHPSFHGRPLEEWRNDAVRRTAGPAARP